MHAIALLSEDSPVSLENLWRLKIVVSVEGNQEHETLRPEMGPTGLVEIRRIAAVILLLIFVCFTFTFVG